MSTTRIKKKLSRIEVEWVDSATFDRWVPRDEKIIREEHQCMTAGYLVHRDKKVIVIAGSIGESGSVCSTMTIPIGCVKRTRRVK